MSGSALLVVNKMRRWFAGKLAPRHSLTLSRTRAAQAVSSFFVVTKRPGGAL